jgi:hypothetical protein
MTPTHVFKERKMREVKHFVFVTLLLYLMATLFSAHASEASQSIQFRGQSYDSVSLTSLLKETQYRDEVVYDTCTRTVPYEDLECRMDTRYREECHMDTRYREECRNETRYRDECRMETRYRQECSMEPSRQRCETTYEQQCRMETRYRQECRSSLISGISSDKERGRENGGKGGNNGGGKGGSGGNNGGGKGGGHGGNNGGNSGGHSGPVCRQVPYTERVCNQVPRQRCVQEPGRRVCRQVPYSDRVCRQVPYTDRVCRQVPYSDRVCRQVPYSERVCQSVTKYKTETYSCTKTVQRAVEVVVKTITNNINIEFESKTDQAINTELRFTQKDSGELLIKLPEGDQRVIATVKTKEVKVVRSSSDVEEKETSLIITFQDKGKLLSPFQGTMKVMGLDSESLTVEVSKIFMPNTLRLLLTIEQNGMSKMAELNLKDIELEQTDFASTRMKVSLKALGIDPFQGETKLKMELKLKDQLDIVGADERDLSLTKSILL